MPYPFVFYVFDIFVLIFVRISEKPNFDGHNMWPVLTGEKYNEYNEILLNIDQLRNISALRKGEWKIISGKETS